MVTEWKKSWKSAKRLKLPRFWGPSSGETIIFTGSTYMPKDSPTLKLVVYQLPSKSLQPFLVESILPHLDQNSHMEPSGTHTGTHGIFPNENSFSNHFFSLRSRKDWMSKFLRWYCPHCRPDFLVNLYEILVVLRNGQGQGTYVVWTCTGCTT